MYASGGLSSAIQTAKKDIGEILQSGKYYCNEEIARELTAVTNGLNHMKLDDRLLSTSPEWQGRKGTMASTTVPGKSLLLRCSYYSFQNMLYVINYFPTFFTNIVK